MKVLRLIIVLFLTGSISCYCAAAATNRKNDTNKPVQNVSADKNQESSDNNDAENSRELLDAAQVEGPNSHNGYIGGDVFNLSFEEILKEYVDVQGLVNYSKLRRYRGQLNQMVEKLADIKPEVYITWSRSEKIAFWINSYNICILKGITDNYPINPSRVMLLFYPANSVMHIRGMRTEMYFMIMGIQYTLDEIERDILLARFEEPRACFAVNYGTIASAPLRNEPYIGKVLDKQLDEQMRNYFARPDAFRVDETARVVYLSPIFKMYKWHEDAFVKKYGTNKLFRNRESVDRAILNFVKDYVSDANADFLKRREYSLEYSKYNWQLNEQPQTKE